MFYISFLLFSFTNFLYTEAHGTKQMNAYMRGIYAHDFFIPSETGRALSDMLFEFIHAYCWEAHQAFEHGVSAFPLFPKLHALHEIQHEMQRQSRLGPWVCNPAAKSCPTDEDFVGRMAVISRSISPRLICRRTIQRYLVHVQVLFARA